MVTQPPFLGGGWLGLSNGYSGLPGGGGRARRIERVTLGGRPAPDDVWALYDLSLDPFETQDVVASHADTVDVLRKWVLDGNFTCQCFQCGWG